MDFSLTVQSDGAAVALEASVSELVIAGWTARDEKAMEEHIRELEQIGVARPARTPTYYRVASSLLTTAPTIEVSGGASSGEAEFVIYVLDNELYVGPGSDHTDREAEKAGVTLSKQLCPKPVCGQVWKFADVAEHWDNLILRSFATCGNERKLYQEGPVNILRDPRELLQGYAGTLAPASGLVMFCGTLGVIDRVHAADRFEIELEDPILGRTLSHAYTIVALPVEG